MGAELAPGLSAPQAEAVWAARCPGQQRGADPGRCRRGDNGRGAPRSVRAPFLRARRADEGGAPADAQAAGRGDRADVERRRAGDRAGVRRLLRDQVRPRGLHRDPAGGSRAVRDPHPDRRAGCLPHRAVQARGRLLLRGYGGVRRDGRAHPRVRPKRSPEAARRSRAGRESDPHRARRRRAPFGSSSARMR